MEGEGQLSEVVTELESVSERLGDLALDALREALRSGATSRPEIERRITRARRAIDRAAGILRGATDDQVEE